MSGLIWIFSVSFSFCMLPFCKKTIEKSFYNVKNGSSIITSKSWSKNLGSENKHAFLIHILSWRQEKPPVLVFVTEILWRTFWCNNWRSVFDVVKILRFSVLRIERLSQFWINLSDSMNLNLKDLSCVSTF